MDNEDFKARLADIEEKIRGNKPLFKLAQYNRGEKVHLKQLMFHSCPKRNRWVFGGNRTGKTECGAVEAIWFARGIHPFREITRPSSGWVVSLTTEVQRDVAQRKLLSYLPRNWIEKIVMRSGKSDDPENGVIDFILVKSIHGGTSVIGFKSCDQGRAKFQGTSQDYIWFDEEPPKDIYDECRMRVMDRQGDIWGTMTPLMGLTWVHDEIYMNQRNDPETWYITMSWQDNPFLPEAERQLLERVLPESERQSRQYGLFTSSSGLVYSEFDENVHVIEPFDVPHQWYSGISIDPGWVNPLSAHWYAQDGDGNIYVIAEHYEKGKDADHHCECIKNICRRLNWPKNSAGRYNAYMDSAALQQTLASQRSVAQIFWELGIDPITRVDKSLWAGIQRVKQYLQIKDGKARLYVFKSCPNMIREFKGYRYGGEGWPIKRDDHAMDDLRYFIMSFTDNSPSAAAPKTEIQRDMERLVRRIKAKQRRLS